MSNRSLASTYPESLQEIIAKFREEHGYVPFSMRTIARWAITKKLWNRQEQTAEEEFAKQLAKAAKLKHHTDPQGRRVRSLIPAKYPKVGKGGQMIFEVLWDDVETMSFEHAEIALTQRYQQVLGVCQSMKNIQDSFNDNNPNAKDRKIQLDLNFGLALEPAEQPEVETIVASDVPHTDKMRKEKPR